MLCELVDSLFHLDQDTLVQQSYRFHQNNSIILL